MTRELSTAMHSARKSLKVFVLGVALSAGLVSPAVAQQIKPLEIEPDPNGVDLLTGQTSTRVPPLAVPGAGRLQFNKMSDILPFLTGNVPAGQESSYQINGGAATSESLSCLDGECQSTKRNGSTLVAGLGSRTFNYMQGGTGTEILFDKEFSFFDQSGTYSFSYYPSWVRYADGEQHSFTYQTYSVNYGGSVITYHRPSKIMSNRGYELRFTYQSNTGNTSTWRTVASAGIYKGSASTTPLAQYTYSGTTITDLANRSWTCGGCTFSMDELPLVNATALTLPDETGPSYTATASTAGTSLAKPVGQVVNDGVVWNYTYQNLTSVVGDPSTPKFDRITVTGPAGATRTAEISHPPLGAKRAPYVTRITNSLGQHTDFVHDTFGRTLKITLPEGNSVEVVYDPIGNIVEKRSKAKPGSGLADLVERANYPAGQGILPCFGVSCFRPSWTRDAKGNQTDYTWDGSGNLLTKLDPVDQNGQRRKTKMTYDALSRPIKQEICAATSSGVELTCGTSNSFVTQSTYWQSTFLPAAETITDGVGTGPLTTTYAYDDAGRQLAVDGALPGSDDAAYARYDVLGRKVWEIGPKGENGLRPATRTTYRNADDQVERVETGMVAGTTPPLSPAAIAFVGDGVLRQADTEFNVRRLAVKSTVSSGGTTYAITQISHDTLNREDCTAVRMNLVSPPANACTVGSPNAGGEYDRISRKHYDSESRAVRIEQAVGSGNVRDYATYTFTQNGQMASMTDARGYRAEMRYDGFDRQNLWYFPQPAQTGAINPNDYEQYGYDANGNRISLRKRDGSVITYQYDNLNRAIRKTVPERSGLPTVHTRDVFYQYDIRDLQLSVRFDSAGGVGTTSAYDRYGRVTSTTDTAGGTARTLSYQYLADGNRWEITYPDLQKFRLYYWPGGQFNHITGPLGEVIVDYNYNDRNELEDIARDATAPLQQWTYDPIGRMASTTINSPFNAFDITWGYTRNPASQIRSESQTNDSYSWNGFVPVDRTYATNGLNQYTIVSGQGYCYDKNGNLTADNDYVYLYDVENRLVEMRARGTGNTNCLALSYAGQIKAELRYDPLGRLYQTTNYINGVSQGAKRYVYDGDALVAEYNAAGTMLARHLHGPLAGTDDPIAEYSGAGVAASNRTNLYTDARGSIVLRTNNTGGSAVINTYDEYGQPGTANVGRFQYTGQAWLSELGMYYYKARIYSPRLGRFLQTDPIGYEDQVNLYAYVANDPINGFDPTGMSCEALDGGDSGAYCDRDNPQDDGPPIVVTGKRPDSGITAGDVGRFLGRAALELAPGGAAVDCAFISQCDTTDIILAGVDLVPGLGKLGKLGKLRKLRRACGCVVAGTLVATPSGLVAIETLEVGDIVLAYDPETDEVVPQPVLDVITTEPKPTYNVVLRSANGETAQFEATDDHPWLNVAKEWRNTEELAVGDRLIARDGQSFEVTEVGLTGKAEVAYTLTVDELHTYIMGEAGLVVHNADCKKAMREFRTNKKFKDYVHKEKQRSGMAGDGAGTRNRDLSESEIGEMYEDWLADGAGS